ncbi:hypothetical protein CFC21_081996 [Triticum aestivum]|uniref:KIB1-4 beta-propeller domain-containing protein n=3 Tax=Triticum TaxID=4564 RepID=A0A9R1I5X1_WHEAT|nr:hypothetical protein CFC21_081987 [Triticum aestivum]KAF7077442.1 hypothetical protein CFC21_081996 [Triticum aestivum]VAI42449.1 unnamed protein product [Triticum turgidum subsp. durum]
MSTLQGWPDLPDDLLHSIVPRLGSFLDLLAFAAACSSWRAAFSSYPSKHTLLQMLPPLLLQPDVHECPPRPRPFSNSLVPTHSCHVTDLANQGTYMRCQIPRFSPFGESKSPQSPLDSSYFGGVSYGHLILFNQNQSCLVIDVFTGVSFSTPKLPVDENTFLDHASLTAPLTSPNSYLMVTKGRHYFFWRVGSKSWLRRSLHNGTIEKVMVFKGQIFGMDNDCRLIIMNLVPRIRIQKITVDPGESMHNKWHLPHPWLVACGDMLLLVGCHRSFPSTGDTFEAFRLDLTSEPAKWMKVEKLENWAIFISTDDRSQPLCCMNPERWGGRSNSIYFYFHDSNNWINFELDKPLQGNASTPTIFICRGRASMMQPTWVVPSMFYS